MATTTPNYDVNLEDERFQQVNTEKENALTDVKNTYDGMINQSDDFYNAQIQASKDWADQQQQIQQEQTDFTIEQIEQQKEQAEKDYKKEQSGAYVDWQKQSNNYGVNAEQMAASGLSTTGYAESSRVGMYNTYQNRVAAAREGFNQATLNYNNAMKEAQLHNSAAKAEIALQAYKEQCALLLEGFQYKNSLLLEQQNQLQATEDRFYSRWQDVYNQIVQENAFKEDIRRYEEQKEYQEAQDALAQENWQKEYDLMLQQAEANSGYLVEDVVEDTTPSETGPYADEQQLEADQYVVPLGQVGIKTPVGIPSLSELKQIRNEKYKGKVTGSNYWNGDYNTDCNEFGTFSNGFQPKGISGYGKVKDSGEKITFLQENLNGEVKEVTQKIWKTPDGSLWYWLGSQNKYVPYESKYKPVAKKAGAGAQVSQIMLRK